MSSFIFLDSLIERPRKGGTSRGFSADEVSGVVGDKIDLSYKWVERCG